MDLAKAIYQGIRDWLGTDITGRINMIINILILVAIVTTCSGVSENGRNIQQIQSQTQATIQPVRDEDILKKQVIELLIQNLNQLDQDKK